MKSIPSHIEPQELMRISGRQMPYVMNVQKPYSKKIEDKKLLADAVILLQRRKDFDNHVKSLLNVDASVFGANWSQELEGKEGKDFSKEVNGLIGEEVEVNDLEGCIEAMLTAKIEEFDFETSIGEVIEALPPVNAMLIQMLLQVPATGWTAKRLGATVKELTAIADNETTTVEFEKVYEVYFEDANEVGIYAPEGELLDWRVANDSDKGNLFSGVAVLGEKATASAA